MNNQQPTHIKIGQILCIYAVLPILAGSFIALKTVFGLIRHGSLSIGAIISMVIAAGMAYLFLAVGQSLKEQTKNSRWWGIAAGVFMIFQFPIGTLLSIYVLWMLIKRWDVDPGNDSTQQSLPTAAHESSVISSL